jgi:Flp pilus assembly pilin Flp
MQLRPAVRLKLEHFHKPASVGECDNAMTPQEWRGDRIFYGSAAKSLSNGETDRSSSAWGSVEVWIFLSRPESMSAARIVRDAMKATLLRFTRDESAATPIEYGLIAFTVAVTIKLATILASAQTAIR